MKPSTMRCTYLFIVFCGARVIPGGEGEVTEAAKEGKNSASTTAQKDAAPARLLLLGVTSSSREATLYTNFTTLVFSAGHLGEAGDSRSSDGLYVMVIHQVSGQVMGSPEHFQPWADLHRLETFLASIQSGRVLVFVLRSDLSYGLPDETRAKLGSYGSAAATSVLGRGVAWAWVWVKGGRTLGEAVSVPSMQVNAPGVTLHATVHLTPAGEHMCPGWPKGMRWDLRRSFCDKYERYGDLCSCQAPHTLPSAASPIANSQLKNAVVVVIAHRVPALYRSLKTVATARGFDVRQIEVFTPEPHEELAAFLEVAGLPLTVTRQLSPFVATLISRQFVFAFRQVLTQRPNADLVIVLEEDITVSPDFFVFLNRTARILQEDPSLHCVSAHNDLSYPRTSRDPRVLLRTASYTNYGWMVTREMAQEMAAAMADMDIEFDWDVFTYFFLRRGRECIIPEVSRSHHFGDAGAHLSQFNIRLYFSSKNYNQDADALVEGAEELEQGRYETHLASLLRRARVLEAHPCQSSFPDRHRLTEEDVLLLFFHFEGDLNLYRGSKEWTALASCLGTFALEPREGHRGLYRLRHGAAHLLLVAHPASPYSKYKPEDTKVFRATPEVLQEAFNRGVGRLRQTPFTTRTPEQQYARFTAFPAFTASVPPAA